MKYRFWFLSVVGIFICAGAMNAEAKQRLLDEELDKSYAQGFQVHLDINLNILENEAMNNIQLLPSLDASFGSLTTTVSGSPSGSINTAPLNTFTPNTVFSGQTTSLDLANSILISGNALANTRNLFNLIVNGGHVGIGVNLQVVINPTNSHFTLSSDNNNFVSVDTLSR